MFKTNKLALNGFLAFAYNDLKKVLKIGSIICAINFLVQLIMVVAFSMSASTSNSNAGMLIVGSGTMLLTFMIGIFVSTANGEIKNAFRYPINRPTYAVGNLIYILASPLIIIAAVSTFYAVELLVYKLLSAVLENFMYINSVTTVNYLEGLIPSYAVMVCGLSVVYMLSMYFHRYKMPFTILLAIFLSAIIFIPGFRSGFSRVIAYGFNIQSIGLFSVFMLGIGLAANTLAFIPLKLMEVK